MTVRTPTRLFALPGLRGLRPAAILAALFTVSAVMGLGLSLGLARPVRAQDPAVPPLNPSATQVMLPVIEAPSRAEQICDTVVEIQLTGDDASKAILITWGEPSLCPPNSAGPLKVECSGLLLPGTTWSFRAAQLPTGSQSGILFSMTAKMLSDIGLAEVLGFDDVVADLMCEELFFGVVGDGDDYRRFKKAFDEGSDFRGIPQHLAAGSPLAVEVGRQCLSSGGSGRNLNLAYSGVPGSALGAFDPVFGGFGYFLPHAVAQQGGQSSQVVAQNAGQDCASVELWWLPRAAPGTACDPSATRCALVALAPGESIRADVAAACSAEDQAGSLWLRSTMPLAVVVDTFGAEAAASYTARTSGAATLIAPLALNDHAGWHTRLHVQNLDPVSEARVKAYFQDLAGDVITAAEQTICARGSTTIDLDAAGLPGNWLGSVRIDSQTLAQAGGGEHTPRIAAVAELVHRRRESLREQVYFELVPGVPDAHDATVSQGTGMVALPSLSKPVGAGGSGAQASEVAIANVVTKPGFTDVAIYLFDQNGVLDVECRKLAEQQVAYIDLRRWGTIQPGFRGSLVASATAWQHDVFDPNGNRVANPVGLAAVVLDRTLGSGPMNGDPVESAGDIEATGYTGIPITPDKNRPFNPAFLGVACPGDQPLPTRTPAPTRTPLPARTATPAPFTPPPGTPLPTVPVPPMEPATPLAPGATQLHLPILNVQGQEDNCRSTIAVQNVGAQPSKAILITWGEPGFCPPQNAGPLKVECSGLIAPGQRWMFTGAQIPTGSRSAAVFSFTGRRLSDVGMAQVLGFDEIIADYMCVELFFGVVGDGDDYRRFKQAYDTGGVFAGLPQYLAAGSPLAVTVDRDCPVPARSDQVFSTTYSGVPGSALGIADPVVEGFTYNIPYAAAGRDGATSRVYVQNAGIDCASVEVWFRPRDVDPLPPAACEPAAQRCLTLTIAPGESKTADVGACGADKRSGSMWLRSTAPVAAVVETTEGPAGAAYSAPMAGGQALVAPLAFHTASGEGWDTRYLVQNLSAELDAEVKVTILDRFGNEKAGLTTAICPRGMSIFQIPLLGGNLPENQTLSARIESLPLERPGGAVSAPDIAGVVELVRTDAAGEPAEMIHYNLLPAIRADRDAGGKLRTGAGLVGLPVISKGLGGTRSTEIAIANTVALPGFTDFAMFIFDQNGLLDFSCQKLKDREIEYIDLATWGFVGPGFTGSAVISATFWEHDVFNPTGDFVRNLVGLGAVTVERGSRANADGTLSGEGSGSEGIALAAEDNRGFLPGGIPGLVNCPSIPPLRSTPTPTPLPFDTPTPLPTGEATPTSTPPPVRVTPTPIAPPPTPTAPRPTVPPSPSPTARSTDLPTPVPSASPTARTPDPTSTVPAAGATATPIAKVCELIRPLVPAEVIDAALADPAAIRGYNQLQYPNQPPGPFNLRRTWLTLADAGRPWNRLYNGLVFKVGCR